MIIHSNEDPFWHVSSPLWTFFCFFLLVREVGDVRWVPLPLLCVWKIDQTFLRSEKESVRVRSSAFSGLCVTFEAGGGLIKKTCVSPHGPVWISAYGGGGGGGIYPGNYELKLHWG